METLLITDYNQSYYEDKLTPYISDSNNQVKVKGINLGDTHSVSTETTL